MDKLIRSDALMIFSFRSLWCKQRETNLAIRERQSRHLTKSVLVQIGVGSLEIIQALVNIRNPNQKDTLSSRVSNL